MWRKYLPVVSIILYLTALIVFGIRSFNSSKYPNPSEAYYLNDYAEVFSSTFANYQVEEAEYIYNASKGIKKVGGAQIVFVSFLMKEGETVADYDKTRIFREWQIGKNNMGILAMLLFKQANDDAVDNYNLVEFQFEVSDKMMIYFTVSEQLRVYNATLNHYLPKGTLTNPYDYDLELGAASMINEIGNLLFEKVYSMPEEVIPQEDFDADFEEYWWEDESASNYETREPLSMTDFFLSPYGRIYDRIIFGSLSALLAVATGGAGIMKAKGGSSSGAGLFGHR
ncbi:MAG: hypothetical protein WC344_02165 [Bacilli bacterium]|jgi:hypothetical protein